MNEQSLGDYISEGLNNGVSAAELRTHAIQEMGVSESDFDHVYDLVLLGDYREPVEVPRVGEQGAEEEQVGQSVADAPEAVQSAPAPVEKIESSAPPVAKRGGFFNWFKVHKLGVFVVVLVSCLTGVGYVAANMFMAPNVNEVRGLIFEQLVNMETVVYQGSIEGEVTTDAAVSLDRILKQSPEKTIANIAQGKVAGSQNTKVRLDFNGSSDVRDINSPKSEFSLTLTASGMVVGLETKSIDDDLFFKITQLPDFGAFEVGDFMNQWFKLDYQKITETLGGETPTRQESLTIEQKQRIVEVFKKSTVFKIAEKIGNDEVDGKAAYHYRYTIDEDALIATIEELATVVGVNEKMTMQEREEFLEWIDLGGGDIWIAKKNYAPLRITFDMSMRSVTDAPVSGRLSVDLKFNKINDDITIDAPYPFKDFSEILNSYQEKSTVAMRDATRLGDVREIMTALELYYNEYNSYPRTLDQLLSAEMPYLLEIPTAPEPPDGVCTLEQNTYQYKAINLNKFYELKFCLGEPTGSYVSGVKKATPQGIY